MLSAVYDFHTEYVIDDELYNYIVDHRVRKGPTGVGSYAICFPYARDFIKYIDDALDTQRFPVPGRVSLPARLEPSALAVLEEVFGDILADRSLRDKPACVYRSERLLESGQRIRTQAHERFHAFVRMLDIDKRFSGPVGNTLVNRETRLLLGLDQFSGGSGRNKLEGRVGIGFFWLAKLNRWSQDDSVMVEESLARIAELEAVYAAKNRALIDRTNKDMARFVANARVAAMRYPNLPEYVQKISFGEQDFKKLYHRIKAKYGSVREFVRSVADPI